MRRLSILFFLFSPLLCVADTIYEKQDANGGIVYSDIPSQNAKPIVIQSAPAVSSTNAVPAQSAAGANAKNTQDAASMSTATTYKTFAISSPTDQTTFQNQREISVTVQLDPELQKGDTIQLYVDGSPYGSAVAGATLTTGQLDRGSHTLMAVLLNSRQGLIKSSNTITIYVQYARLGGSS